MLFYPSLCGKPVDTHIDPQIPNEFVALFGMYGGSAGAVKAKNLLSEVTFI